MPSGGQEQIDKTAEDPRLARIVSLSSTRQENDQGQLTSSATNETQPPLWYRGGADDSSGGADILGGHSDLSSPTSVTQAPNDAAGPASREERGDHHGENREDVRDEALTAQNFALEAHRLEMIMDQDNASEELLAQDVQDYRRTAQLLTEKVEDSQGNDSDDTTVLPDVDAPVVRQTTTNHPLAAVSNTEALFSAPSTNNPSTTPPTDTTASQFMSNTEGLLPPENGLQLYEAVAIPVNRIPPLEIDDVEAVPFLSEHTIMLEQQERRLLSSVREEFNSMVGSVRVEIQRAATAAFPRAPAVDHQDGHRQGCLQATEQCLYQSPSALRILKRRWYFLVLFLVWLYVAIVSIPQPLPKATDDERPPDGNMTEIPRSTLPVTLKPLFGRDEILRKLGQYMKKPGSIGALTGGAGVGKSHCARKFAHDWVQGGTKNRKRLGFWISAETESEVRHGYNDILEALGVEIEETNDFLSTSHLADIVWEALTQTFEFEWIVVFDNVPAVDAELEEIGPDVIKDWFFPHPHDPRGLGRILITTHSWSYQGSLALGEIRRFDVHPLSTKPAVEMLFARLNMRWEDVPRKTRKKAELLVGKDYFNGLPIAIEAAAAHMNRTGLPLAEYLERMEGDDSQSRINEAIQKNVDFAHKQGHRRILDIMAFVSPDGIPVWLLGDDDVTMDAVSQLSTLSILQWDDHDHFSLHRLYQKALQKDGHMDSAMVAVDVVMIGFDRLNHSTWRRPVELLPHVRSLKDRFGEHQFGKNETLAFSRVLCATVWPMEYASFDYIGAERYLQDALDMKFTVYGRHAKNADLAETISNLGVVLHRIGDYKNATAKYEQALDMKWAVYGRDANNQDIAETLNNLGNALSRMGEYESAKANYQQSLEMKWAVYGRNATNGNLAATINNLGNVLGALGDYPGAKAKLEQALDMKRAVYGKDANNTDLASSLNNLGLLLHNMKDFQGAKAKYEQALEMKWAVYGPDANNTEIAGTLNNLGLLLTDTENYQEAKAKYEQALEMEYAVYGPDAVNADLAETISNLGMLLSDIGEYKRAKLKLEQAMAMMWALYGPDAKNEDLARSILAIGTLLENTGDVQGARERYQEAIQMLEDAYGEDSGIPLLATARDALERLEEIK